MPHVAITQIYQPIHLHTMLLLTMTCHQQLVTPPWLVSTSLVLQLDESLAQFPSRRQHLYGELSWGTNNTNSTTMLTVCYKQFSIVVPGAIHHHPETRPSAWWHVAGRLKATKKWGRISVQSYTVVQCHVLNRKVNGKLTKEFYQQIYSFWDGVDDWIELAPL